jgi:hypothetical protein
VRALAARVGCLVVKRDGGPHESRARSP